MLASRLKLFYRAPLVPVISFGETDLYSQVEHPEGSFMRSVQEFLRKATGIAPIMFVGRGFFQYNFGLAPRRSPVTTVSKYLLLTEINTFQNYGFIFFQLALP